MFLTLSVRLGMNILTLPPGRRPIPVSDDCSRIIIIRLYEAHMGSYVRSVVSVYGVIFNSVAEVLSSEQLDSQFVHVLIVLKHNTYSPPLYFGFGSQSLLPISASRLAAQGPPLVENATDPRARAL